MNRTFLPAHKFINCRKISIWIILASVSAGLALMACSPRTVRHGNRYGNRIESTQVPNETLPKGQELAGQNDAPLNGGGNKLMSELEEYERNILKNKQETPGEDALAKKNQNERRIPTLREQMEYFNQEQNKTNTKVAILEKDVKEIKQTLEDIKFEIMKLNGSIPSEAVTGESPAAGGAQYGESGSPGENLNDGESLILSDEAMQQQGGQSKSPNGAQQNNSYKKPRAKKSYSSPAKNTIPKKSRKPAVKKASYPTAKSKPVISSNKKSAPEVEKQDKKIEELAESNNNKNGPNSGGFNSAMDSFREKNYHKAIIELSNILKDKPGQAESAKYNYWLGEAHYGLRQYGKAIGYFEKSANSGNHGKTGAALVMLGESRIRAGNIEGAKQAFAELLKRYPRSKYVPRARKMLQQL